MTNRRAARICAFYLTYLSFVGCGDGSDESDEAIRRAEPYAELTVTTAWDGVEPCAGGIGIHYDSPVFVIEGIPEETELLEFDLNDVTSNIHHTTASIPYTSGERIEAGRFQYLGPCPFEQSAYAWRVTALSAERDVEFGSGGVTLFFP